MRALVLIHRWLGVALCLLFAMWFTTGIVMHFVPFPALTEAERIAGLARIEPAQVVKEPAAAIKAVAISDVTRLRLIARSDGAVYIAQSENGIQAVRAADLSPASVQSPELALEIALAHAQLRGLAHS